MAHGQSLPYYYKNSKLVGLDSRKKTWKEYYLLVVIIVAFLMLIAGVLWFVPSVEEEDNYKQIYDQFTSKPEQVGGMGVLSESSLLPGLPLNSKPVEVVSNELKREAKVKLPQRELEQDPPNLAVPVQDRVPVLDKVDDVKEAKVSTTPPPPPPSKSSSEHHQEEEGGERDAEDGGNDENRPLEVESREQEEDTVVRDRREKVVDVSLLGWLSLYSICVLVFGFTELATNFWMWLVLNVCHIWFEREQCSFVTEGLSLWAPVGVCV